MIGVIASAGQRHIVQEFFNLFKTPWEFCRPGSAYAVLICSDSQLVANSAQLTVVYGSKPGRMDAEMGIRAIALRGAYLSYAADRIPIYGDCLSLSGNGKAILRTLGGEVAGVELNPTGSAVVRLGFDLFAEIERLLRRGQPPENARIPTLDLQIALLRDLIVTHSISLFEIPPVPAGYQFIACLTHDVDHPSIKNHRWDHTMLGFLFRAIIGSFIAFCRGRRSFGQLATNWKAAFSLPFVYLGLVKDFWKTIARYREIEGEAPSTFFIISERNNSGRQGGKVAHPHRAASYGIADLRDEIQALISTGCEVGLHGLDAWHDSGSGRVELAAIRAVTGDAEIGVRMHWLFFEEQSPVLLEKAGFSYDSTVGYNETVGFRAGTLQAYKPLDVDRLLELPMHIMDTALFYPAHLDLSVKQAEVILDEMVEQVVRFGGSLNVNWHDRSIAPERQWEETYVTLLNNLKRQGAWFATCAQTVAWFNRRRTAVLEETDANKIKVMLPSNEAGHPDLLLRLHNAHVTEGVSSDEFKQDAGVADVIINESKEIGCSHLDRTAAVPAWT